LTEEQQIKDAFQRARALIDALGPEGYEDTITTLAAQVAALTKVTEDALLVLSRQITELSDRFVKPS
jgi:signal transduction histidine kinase